MSALKLEPSRFVLAEYKRCIYLVIRPVGEPIEAVLDPSYWAHVARNLQAGFGIVTYTEDFSHYAELLVLRADSLSANVAIVLEKSLTDAKLEAVTFMGHVIDFAGPIKKHTVTRKSDGRLLRDGFNSFEDARDYIKESAKSMRSSAA